MTNAVLSTNVTPIPDAKWKNLAANAFSLFFSKEVMLQAYIPATKRNKPYVRLLQYEPVSHGFEFKGIVTQISLPDERDEASVKKNALRTAVEYLRTLSANATAVADILDNDFD